MAVDYLADPDIPWRAIFELFEAADETSTPKEYIACLMKGIDRIIPYDVGCGLLRADGKYVASYGLQAKTVADYNDHYLSTMTFIPQSLAEAYEEGSKYELLPVVWDQFRMTEFVEDFCRPINLTTTLTYFLPRNRYSLTMHRGQGKERNSATEKTILRIFNSRINRYLDLYKDHRFGCDPVPRPAALRARFPALSARECAVVLQSCNGMSARFIAEREGLSRRTIESQLLSAYIKLNVENKRALVEMVVRGPEEGGLSELVFVSE